MLVPVSEYYEEEVVEVARVGSATVGVRVERRRNEADDRVLHSHARVLLTVGSPLLDPDLALLLGEALRTAAAIAARRTK